MQTRWHGSRTWRDAEGKGTLGCLISILLVGILIFLCMQLGPPYFAYKGLETDIGTEISKAGSHFYGDDVLLQNILDVAKKNEVRLKRENIKIERFAGQVQALIEYSVPVDLYLFRHTMNFRIKASSYIGTL